MKKVFLILILVGIAIPSIPLFAEDTIQGNDGQGAVLINGSDGENDPGDFPGPTAPDQGVDGSGSIDNSSGAGALNNDGIGIVPGCEGSECGINDLIQLLYNVYIFFIGFAIAAASIAFAYAGFLYITSQGDTNKISRANKIFTNFAVGLFLVLGAFLIIELIINSLGLNPSLLFFWG